MPYRALLWTMVTLAVALLALAMWLRAIDPVLVWIRTSEAAATAPGPHGPAGTQVSQEVIMAKSHLRMVLILELLLVSLLLVVGMASTMREWMRYGGTASRLKKRRKTPYVDAWKIAGQRLKEKDPPP